MDSSEADESLDLVGLFFFFFLWGWKSGEEARGGQRSPSGHARRDIPKAESAKTSSPPNPG